MGGGRSPSRIPQIWGETAGPAKSAGSGALCSMTTILHWTVPHPYTSVTHSFPFFSTSIPFLFTSQENDLILPPTLCQVNVTFPQTSLPVHGDNPEVTFTPIRCDFWHGYFILPFVPCDASLPIPVSSPGQGCRVPVCLWFWMVFGANGAPATGRYFPFFCSKIHRRKMKRHRFRSALAKL